MALPNSEKITSQLATLPDQALKQMATMHKQDPYVLPLIISEDGRRKQMRQAAQAQMAQMAQPKVADAAVDQMGIAQLPTPNMQHMADGGIAGYDDGGMAEGGGPASQLEFNNEPVIRMANGGVTKMSGTELFNKALDIEGITDPKERAFLKALHGQESSSKSSAPTSNQDARGAMQILPTTFKQVADKDMDINKPLDNMRAGIRYGKKGFDAAGGDPVLAGAYYYGGPGGMQKAAKGVAVSDPENPKAPTTIDYGQSIAQRMTELLPIGTAQAEEAPKKTSAQPQKAGLENALKTADDTAYGGLFSLTAPGVMAAAKDAGNTLFQKFGHQPANIGPMQPQQALTNAQKFGRAAGTLAVPAAVLQGGLGATKVAGNNLKLMSGDVGREMAENSMLSAMSGDTGLAAAIMDAAQNNPEGPPKMPYSQQMLNAGKLAVGHPDIDRMREANKKATVEQTKAEKPFVKADPGVYDREDMEEGAAKFEAPKAAEAVAVGKAAAPEGAKQGLTNDDYLTMGLSLLANKSRNLMTAIGEAGLNTVANKRAREKSEMEKEYMQAHGESFRAGAEQARANAAYLNSGVKGVGAVQKMANENYDNWLKAMEANPMLKMQLTPELAAQKQKEFLQKAYSAYKMDVPTDVGSATSAPSSDPLGILSKKG